RNEQCLQHATDHHGSVVHTELAGHHTEIAQSESCSTDEGCDPGHEVVTRRLVLLNKAIRGRHAGQNAMAENENVVILIRDALEEDEHHQHGNHVHEHVGK